MKGILSREGLPVLEQFAWSNVLLAFDFDGTLAPIVVRPERAWMRSRTRERLRALSNLYPVVVISGRGKADVLRRLQGTGVCDAVGNHGIEPSDATARVREQVIRWGPGLRRDLVGLRGVQVEDKGYSIAVHYRRSREKKRARAVILAAAARLAGVRIIGGKQVVNLLPSRAPHKGLALERELERCGCDTAIYVGDDETDEDVFSLNQPGRLLSIRVGAKRESMADFCLRGQRDVDELIRTLIMLRSASGRRGRGTA